MSGGRFDYKQYIFQDIIDSLERELNKSGKLKDKDELWYDEDWYKKYPEDKYYPLIPDNIEEEIKITIKLLKETYIRVQRIDWYLSGDDGEESFFERLNEELKQIEK